MSALNTVQAIVVRDLSRALRQRSRLLGGLVRPFMWLLLVGTGYNAIAHVDGAVVVSGVCLSRDGRHGESLWRHADGDLDGLRP